MKDEKNTRKEQNHEKNSFNPMCKLFECDYIRRAVKEILEEDGELPHQKMLNNEYLL